MLNNLMEGLVTIIDPSNLLILLLAVVIGFLGGAIPGISGLMLVVVLLPVTYGMETTSAFMLLTAIYAAAVFSGMITAILYRAPGTPESVTTVYDGYPMTRRGEAGKALGIGILSSTIGGIIGTIFLIALTPTLAQIALQFASPEYFALAVVALTVVAALSDGKLVLGFIGVAFGLLLATVGIDAMTGAYRFTFGFPELASGIDLVPVVIGLFAISETINRMTQKEDGNLGKTQKFKIKIFDSKIFKKITGTLSRSSLLGVGIGILPGIGPTTAAILAYSESVRWSKTPEQFGKGAPEGIAAPESANNAAAMGALVPLFALGIPGSATAAVMLGAFIMHGLQPGPNLMSTNGPMVYAIFAGLLIVNIVVLIFSKPFIVMFSKLLTIPYSIIGPLIVIFCTVGTFAIRNSMFDVIVMLIFGILGFLFEKIRFPLITIVLGVVLGSLAESEFRRSLELSGGDLSIFATRPISAVLLGIAILMVIFPITKQIINKRKKTTTN
ncbi:tripartite tricarboxylate transporter permease [Oceanobacillus jeddahense]|uniref:Tripartite tricarboxylate transporter permease n=1 Tax=Oceanobacillus jeddahense TaxID=1462527 RepID=A0ABY5JRX6_9BACI|nr:tripartite tricarboxylate transporter permease [Oceanobacillus jeddahense]UUI03051.1 tripartite tricarboxylate transporter permease [Oceanobacillus jeddahense]